MKRILFILSFTISEIVQGQCTPIGPNQTGPNSYTSFSNNAATGTYAWASGSNAQLSDNSYSSASILLGILSSANSNYLVAQNPGFSVPSIASICGIVVEMEKSAGGLGIGASISDNVVKLVKGGSIGGTNHASGASWTSSDSYFTYGSSSDLWGLTWTPADVNGAGFGVAVSATTSTGLVSLLLSAQVDHIRITVYYSVPLPVTFRDFFAIPDQSAMKLKWSTASEANSVRFVAEKYSEINAEWIPVDSVIAAGNSSIEKKYEAFDKSPGDLNIYRIRQVDMDGRFMFSKTITAGFHTRGITRVKIFPNPVQDKIQINSPDPLLHVKMLSVEGKEMFNLIPGTGCRNITIPVENMLPGLYFLQIQTSLGTDVEKIVHH